MDEAASDVYGLLNVGPTFVFNLAAFFTTLVHQLENVRIGVLGNVTFLDQDNRPDVHPTDLLRVSLGQGVIENLQGLSVARRNEYSQAVDQLLGIVTNGATEIDFVAVENGRQQVVQSFPLADMQQAAKDAGAFIATVKLDALDGHSIQDIETWDDADEDKAQQMLAALSAGQAIGGMGDDAQVLAAATLALLQTPSKYAQVTKAINAALDVSFAGDPIFGSLQPHHMIVRPSMRIHFSKFERPVAPPVLGLLEKGRGKRSDAPAKRRKKT
jgi:hypothetical protein